MRFATALRSFKYTLQGLCQSGEGLTRRAIDAVMVEYLTQNKDLLALACCTEPNVIDGRDAEFANTAGTDASGRYIPYWNRGSGKIAVEPLQGYDQPGANDWYEMPRKAGHDVMMEPYDYPIGGRTVQITSLMSPLTLRGRFAGILGADYSLEQLQTELSQVKPFGVGALVLISNGGIYAAHPDTHQLGRSANDLTPQARTAISAGQPYHYLDDKGVARIFHPLQIGESKQSWAVMVMFDVASALRSGAR